MKARHGLSVLMVAAMLAGVPACASDEEPGATVTGTVSHAGASPPATGTGSAASDPADPVPAEEATITIRNFDYAMPETIAPGATVTVVNEDDAPHTVTAKDGGGFDVDVAAGATATFTAPDDPGEYAVICIYHPAMSGTLVIG